jgi:type II restriction enzyme dpnII
MDKRNFEEWLDTMIDSIANFEYYIDFETIYKNAEIYKVELNVLNSLIGSKNIEKEFESIIERYPEVLKTIPILLAVRNYEISVLDENERKFDYNFKNMNYTKEEYSKFMRKTGLFDLLENHLVSNIYDYVLGVECGLNSNARKNRGGILMEELVEKYLEKAGYIKDKNYFSEMYIEDIEERWKVDLSSISADSSSTKRFDFVVKTKECIYAIETNFYAVGGSKLNEVARSYKMIALESKEINKFKFIWITDGEGWKSAKRNLKETFDVLENIYNITDMKNGILDKIFK